MILAASPASGKLADRVGRARVMHLAFWIYGLGLLAVLRSRRRSSWPPSPSSPSAAA